MALLDSEVQRIRAELGYNTMGVQAEPYITTTAIFNSVIQNYITAGVKTTSSSPVPAQAVQTPTSIVVADATGIHAGDMLVVDVDARQEKATVVILSGSTVTLQLALAHSGTYPVTVEGGESIVREILRQLMTLRLGGAGGKLGAMAATMRTAGIKKVDDVEFFGGGSGGGIDQVTQTMRLIEYWRDELAATLGVQRLNRRSSGGVEAY